MVNIPGLGDIKRWVKDVIEPVFDTFQNNLLQWLWAPLAWWLQQFARNVNEISQKFRTIESKFLLLLSREVDFWKNPIKYIGNWLLQSFSSWIDDLSDLVEDYIESYWDW